MLLFAGLSAAALAQSPVSPALSSLVETERAFARMSVERGRREAFLSFFGDSALFFTPAPANAREIIRKWPETSTYTLDWEPRFGDVAAAGDLGYTTGPFTRTSRNGTAAIVGSGWYFTLWKKQADGGWKVAIDAGVEAPSVGPLRPAAFRPVAIEPVPAGDPHGSPLEADRTLCASIAASGVGAALRAAGDEATLIYREGRVPSGGAAAIKSVVQSEAGRASCEPLKEVVSASVDLGYTYGTYSIDALPKGKGYYVRVWRARPGGWKLAVDVQIPGE